jgi:Flp pilus assembly pilin Flp
MIATLMRLAQNEEGATAAEYGLIAVLIALALIAALELVAS